MEFRFQPARDFGLPGLARLRSLHRERGLVGTLTHWCWRRLVRNWLAVAHRLRVTGRENLPAAPLIVVANHSSHLDALVLMAALPDRLAARSFAMAAGELFFANRVMATFSAYLINALPVWRGRTRPKDLAEVRARLAEDRMVVILFPEGTRSRTGTMTEFKPGIGALVAAGTTPVVPCHIEGAFDAWPPTRSFPRPRRLAVRIGPALHFDAVPNDRAGWETVARDCEAAVRTLATAPAAPT